MLAPWSARPGPLGVPRVLSAALVGAPTVMRKRPSRVVHAALAVIERRGRYLICRRRQGDFLGGYWEFPGGKREPGESWEACVRREAREELGVVVRVRGLCWSRRARGAPRAKPVASRLRPCGATSRARAHGRRPWAASRERAEGGGHVRFKAFRCAIARGTPRPLAAQALRWVSGRSLSRYRFPPANQELIASLCRQTSQDDRRGKRVV